MQKTETGGEILPRLNLLHLEITVRWQRQAAIPRDRLPNILRGAFNMTFRRLVCPPEWIDRPCKPCSLYSQCPYGQLFEASPPPDAERLSKQSDLPRPFVLKPPRSSPTTHSDGLRAFVAAGRQKAGDEADRQQRPPGSGRGSTAQMRAADHIRWQFALVLFGRASDHLAHFIVTLGELGRAGLGPQRVPFTIEAIDACYGDTRIALYDPQRREVEFPERQITQADLLRDLPVVLGSPPGPREVHVRMLTPTLIRAGSHLGPDGRPVAARELREQVPFGALIRRLRDRLAALCAFFGPQPWQPDDFAELGRRADQVLLVASHTRWENRARRSTRTGHQHELSGLTGTTTYQFPTPQHAAELLPLLRFGELMHVGKHTVWGNGWLDVQLGPAATQ